MTWWQCLWHRKQLEEQLDKELRFHLEQHAADLEARGADPGEARRVARERWVDLSKSKKSAAMPVARVGWRTVGKTSATRYALLRQNCSFAAVALLTLALGNRRDHRDVHRRQRCSVQAASLC